jgi:ATP-dependent Clp protease ATP-binding subunit ClpA
MFETFTVASREVVVRASDEARTLGDDYIGTEHLLLGLLTEGGSAGRVLAGGGLTRERIQDRLGRRAPGITVVAGQMLPFTKPALIALERAVAHATAAGVDRVAPEHLLLGVADAAEGVTEELLRSAGVELPPAGDGAAP